MCNFVHRGVPRSRPAAGPVEMIVVDWDESDAMRAALFC